MAEPPPRGRGRAALYGKIRAESKVSYNFLYNIIFSLLNMEYLRVI